MIDEAKNLILKQRVTEQMANPQFRHHLWYVTYPIEIVEQIAHELCDLYPEADRQYVDALLWLHDYEKAIDFDDQYNTELAATKQLMESVGYSSDTIADMAESINLYNARVDLQSARIEVQIVSSADAASHLTGPFVALYWYENPTKSIAELQQDNLKKLAKDWDTKITLPEVKKAFEARYKMALEVAGVLPSSYIE